MKQTPNFFVVGCQRCGTTWIDTALRDHPQIYLPKNKQCYFFDRNYHQGIDKYLSRFENIDLSISAIGEVATGYCLPGVIEKVHHHFPMNKLIFVMRNPIERAYSNYLIRKDYEQWVSFEDAIERSDDLILRGLYYKQLKRIYQLYPKNNVLPIFYDDLVRDNSDFIQKIYSFLDVDQKFKPTVLNKKVNSNSFAKIKYLIHKYKLTSISKGISKTFIGTCIRKHINSRENMSNTNQIEKSTIKYLNDIYEKENSNLFKLLNRDDIDWNVQK